MAGTRLFVLVLCLLGTHSAMATWTVRDQEALGLNPVAYAQSANGERVAIFLGDGSVVYLCLQLGAGFETFSASNCPTFQIDDRTPMHHFEVGYRCAVVAKRATYLLGPIVDQEITSLVLHRFMNGNQVSFRYTVKNGQYRQSIFPLGSSKQALTRALGSDTHILVE